MRLIDADALMEYCSNQKTKTVSCNDIARFPTIEERKTGKWIDDGTYGDYHPHHAWHCSECEESVIEIDTPWFKFCPNCGADMRKDGD